MIVDGRAVEASAVMQVAHLMALAARTAPKGRGADHIETVVVSGEDLQQLGEDVISYGEETGQPLYVRDGNCLQKCQALLIIGIKNVPMGLKNCGFCGFSTCGDCAEIGGMCAIRQADLGIAVGSAASVAADHRTDTRVLFSVGKKAIDFDMFGNSLVKNAYALGLSSSGKNPFFDRPDIWQSMK